ncbi:MAG: DHH family phosphoesterase [Anaerolineae bacterium]|jgi:nanoRNase/pAp phosphatase (c-di-AMP/oligoRNAs hydrolase)
MANSNSVARASEGRVPGSSAPDPGRLIGALGGAREILILPHNDPDPDAIASALALQHLLAQLGGVESEIVYRGLVGRAENKALVRYLGQPLRWLQAADLRSGRPLALVDTQPGTGNNALPPGRTATLVFDHHPRKEGTAGAAFADVRSDLGATSTMLFQYLRAADLPFPPHLATALFYGIKTDTLGLVRGARPADVEAYFELQQRVDMEALVEIESAQVPPEYFRRLHAALHAARLYGNVVVSYVGAMQRPDLAAEMADLLLRLEGIEWVLCMGAYQDRLQLAMRSRREGGSAGRMVQAVVAERGTAGGHGMMAAGQIPLEGRDPEEEAALLARRARVMLEVEALGEERLLVEEDG